MSLRANTAIPTFFKTQTVHQWRATLAAVRDRLRLNSMTPWVGPIQSMSKKPATSAKEQVNGNPHTEKEYTDGGP